MEEGAVIWITGLSGVGKSSLARALLPRLAQPRLHLDGDELREALSPLAGGYAPQQRLKLALTYARLAQLASRQGQYVVCSTISLFHDVHEWNRNNITNYIEILLKTSDNNIKNRDYKNIYKNFDNNVMGTSIAPEYPLSPDIVIDNSAITILDTLEIIISFLDNNYSFILNNIN
jgi:adenylylsulfate kinase